MHDYPELDPRTRGWLRHLWRNATTPDDWSRGGEPHPWWDRYSTPPMADFPRFDLSESSYALALMADRTPAWRVVYTHRDDARERPDGAIDLGAQALRDANRHLVSGAGTCPCCVASV